MLGWSTGHIHARVPDVAGVFDQDDAQLQVRHVAAADVAEVGVQFRARRVSHEVYGPAMAQHVRGPAGATQGFAPLRPQQHVVGLVAATGSATAGVRVQARESGGTLEIAPAGAPAAGAPPIIGVVLDLPAGTDPGLGMPSLNFMPGRLRTAATPTAAG